MTPTPYPEAQAIQNILQDAQRIVIVQADNPDGDSMGSALALEQILHELGREPILYCGVDVPSYLTYLAGWDRIVKELPSKFDASIIVDTSAGSLLEQLEKSGQKSWITNRPVIVLDHHDVENTIAYATVVCNKKVVATGELVYELAQQLDWPLNADAKNMIATAMLSDSLGLTTDATTGRSIHIIAELVEGGVSIPTLEQKRRSLMTKSPRLTKYKGQLLERIEYFADNRIAIITIPWEEIESYSPEYNPSMLVMEDMRLVTGMQLVIAFKQYDDGKVTGKIRANYGYPVAGKLAEHFNGGGHAYASGFKTTNARPFNEVKSECIQFATELLDNLDKENSDETLQHSHA